MDFEITNNLSKRITIHAHGHIHTHTHIHPTVSNWGGVSGTESESTLQKVCSRYSFWRPHLHASLPALPRSSEDLINCKESLKNPHAIGKVRFPWTKALTSLMGTSKKWLSGHKKQICVKTDASLSTFYFIYLYIFFHSLIQEILIEPLLWVEHGGTQKDKSMSRTDKVSDSLEFLSLVGELDQENDGKYWTPTF